MTKMRRVWRGTVVILEVASATHEHGPRESVGIHDTFGAPTVATRACSLSLIPTIPNHERLSELL